VKKESETIKFLEELKKQITSLPDNPPDYESLKRSPAWKNLSQHEKERLESLARAIRLHKSELKRMERKMLTV
jgi:hypothetical protein